MPRKGETLSPEHKAKLHAAAEARRAANTATAEHPVAAAGDPLRDLAALIVRAASQDAEEAEVVKQFTALLDRIDLKKHAELRDHPAMQGLLEKAFDNVSLADAEPGRIAPGTVHGTGWQAPIEPWTWQHVEFLRQQEPDGMFKLKTVDCIKTERIIINGLSCWFPEGQTITWYAPWVDMYRQALRTPRLLERYKAWLFKQGPWAPNVPAEMQPLPEADWQEDSNAFRLRAEADGGLYGPGMGWNPAVDGRRAPGWLPGAGPAPAAPPEGAPAEGGEGAAESAT